MSKSRCNHYEEMPMATLYNVERIVTGNKETASKYVVSKRSDLRKLFRKESERAELDEYMAFLIRKYAPSDGSEECERCVELYSDLLSLENAKRKHPEFTFRETHSHILEMLDHYDIATNGERMFAERRSSSRKGKGFSVEAAMNALNEHLLRAEGNIKKAKKILGKKKYVKMYDHMVDLLKLNYASDPAGLEKATGLMADYFSQNGNPDHLFRAWNAQANTEDVDPMMNYFDHIARNYSEKKAVYRCPLSEEHVNEERLHRSADMDDLESVLRTFRGDNHPVNIRRKMVKKGARDLDLQTISSFEE